MLLAATGCGGEPADPPRSGLYAKVKDWTCADVGQEAIRISRTGGRGAKLLTVRRPVPLQDNRVPGMALPTGKTDQALLLHCAAKATWSDASRSPVDLRWTVDPHGEQYVYYQSIEK